MSGVRDEQRRTPPRNGPRCAPLRARRRAPGLMSVVSRRRLCPASKNAERKSHIERQPTTDRTRFTRSEQHHSVPRCPVWTPRRNSQHDPEPRGTAIGANRANRGARMTKTAAASTSGHRNPCAAPADRHVPLCTRNRSGSDLRRSVSENRVRRTDELGRSGPRV